jgi:hypothetical protein
MLGHCRAVAAVGPAPAHRRGPDRCPAVPGAPGAGVGGNADLGIAVERDGTARAEDLLTAATQVNGQSSALLGSDRGSPVRWRARAYLSCILRLIRLGEIGNGEDVQSLTTHQLG